MHYTRLLFSALMFGLVTQGVQAQRGGGNQSRQISARLMQVSPGQVAAGSKAVNAPLMGPLSHPLLESVYTGSSSEVVARTAYGNVTSRDLWLWITMQGDSGTKANLLDELKNIKLPKDRERIRKALKSEIDDYVFVNFIIPKIQSGVPATSVNELKNEIYLLPAYQTVFLEKIIKPELVIEDADRQKYLQENIEKIVPQTRWRTRYIFRQSHESDSADVQSGIEVDLDTLRTQISSGELSFADAARGHSQAPSAKNGGEIPPFKQGELFFHYENAVSNLKPGEISETFRGPGGFYMVQLIETLQPEEASLSNAVQAKKVDDNLLPKVMKNAFRMEMRTLLEGKYFVTKKAPSWDSLTENEVLGKSGAFTLTKGEYLGLYPDTEGDSFAVDFDLMDKRLRNILEKEAFAQEVRRCNLTNDPTFQKACVIASNLVRRDAFEERIQAGLDVTETTIRNFWKNNQSLFTPLALKRVSKLTLSPISPAPLPTQTREELDSIVAVAAGKSGSISRIKDREVLDDERSDIVRDFQDDTVQAFDFMRQPMEMPTTEEGDKRTSEAHEIIKESVPENFDQPESSHTIETKDHDVLSTDSIDSLKEIISETTKTTSMLRRGGAAPTPVAGGGTAPTSTNEVYGLSSAESKEKMKSANWVAGESAVADRPKSGPVPVGIANPELKKSGAKLTAPPKELKHANPPATSAIPYNPDWFYLRSKFSGVGNLVEQYKNSDWILKYEDLGFIYVEDHPEIPAKVDKMPLHSLSRAYMDGQVAVSYYIEEVRSVEKPDFESAKPYAYDVYQKAQVDKKVSEVYNSELKKANIRYEF